MGPHAASETIMTVARQLTTVLQHLIRPDLIFLGSQFFLRPPGSLGQPWHQDETYMRTNDSSLVSLWIALDNMSLANGGLTMLPGSHRPNVLWPTQEHNLTTSYDAHHMAVGFPYDVDKESVPLELNSTAALVFGGHL